MTLGEVKIDRKTGQRFQSTKNERMIYRDRYHEHEVIPCVASQCPNERTNETAEESVRERDRKRETARDRETRKDGLTERMSRCDEN